MTPEQMARVREIVACAREHHALRDTYVIDPLDIDVLTALLAAVERIPPELTRYDGPWGDYKSKPTPMTKEQCETLAEDERYHRRRAADFVGGGVPQVHLAIAEALTVLLAEVERIPTLVAAATELVDMIDECEPKVDAAIVIATLHGCPYTGPSWGHALTTLRRALMEPTP